MNMQLPIISLNSRAAVLQVIRRLSRNSRVRHKVFMKVAKQPELQKEILAVIAKHPVAGRRIVMNVAQDPQLFGKMLRLLTRQS